MSIRGLFAVVVVLAALSCASAAQAATTIQVNTTGDPGPPGTTSLRQAVAAAGDSDTVSVPPGHYTLALGQITVPHAITIAGAGASSTTVDGNNASRIFNLTSTGLVTIENLTLTRAKEDAGTSHIGGGAVYSGAGSASFSGDAFTNNSVIGSGSQGQGGGAIYNDSGSVTISNSFFQGNSATISGAGTTTTSGGGAVYNDGSAITISNATLIGNSASVSGGASSNGGGAIYDNGNGVTISASTLTDNSASVSASSDLNGGGAYFDNSGGLTATDTSFTNNTLTVTGGTLANGGGAVYTDGTRFNLTRGSITGNTAMLTTTGDQNGGGGVYDEGALTLVNVTLADNTLTAPAAANNGGGGFYGDSGARFANVTVADNHSNQPGGGLFVFGALRLKSTIIAGNSAATGNASCAGILSSDGNNLEDTTPTQCHLTGTGDLVGVNPNLGPLANNGGPGPTHALQPPSQAIDHIPAAQCTDEQNSPQPVSTDERGVPRGLDGFCDIGAYETAPADLSLSASASPAKLVVSQRSTVTYTIADTGPAPATNTSLKLTLPSGLQLVSATPSQGSCAGVTCSLDTVTAAGAGVTVVVTGTKKGSQTLTGTVSASEADPTPADNTANTAITVTAPKLSKLKVKHGRILFTLNVAAAVKFTIERCTGKGKHGKCKKVKTIRVKGKAGANRVKLKRKKLKAGRYKLIAVPSVLGQKGKKVSMRFRLK